MTAAIRPANVMLTVRDLVALTKPRITLMVLVTAAGGMWLAPGTLEPGAMAVMLLTTGMVVAAGVLVYRLLTWLMLIPVGLIALGGWHLQRRRQPGHEAGQARP